MTRAGAAVPVPSAAADRSDARAKRRARQARLAALAALLSKALAVGVTLLSYPLVLDHLGPERFGVWATLGAALLALQFADLGLGNGVVNHLSAAAGPGQRRTQQRVVASAALALAGVAVVLAGLALLVVPVVDWAALLGLTEPLAQAEARAAVAVLAGCVALAVPLSLVQRVQIALQRGHLASLWQCAANGLSLLLLLAAVQAGLGLPWLVAALLGAPLATALVNAALFFGRQMPRLRPRRADVDPHTVRALLHTGALYLGIQVAVTVVFTSDALFIAHTLGAAQVAVWAAPERLFSIVTLAVATAVGPLWPAYGEALARGDVAWVRRTLVRSMQAAGLAAAVLAVLLWAAGPWLVAQWVGPRIELPAGLLASLALWKVIEALGLAFGAFLNGAGLLRYQLLTATLMALAVLLLKPWALQRWGLPGAPLATAAVYTAVMLLPLAWAMPRLWQRATAPRAAPPGLAPKAAA